MKSSGRYSITTSIVVACRCVSASCILFAYSRVCLFRCHCFACIASIVYGGFVLARATRQHFMSRPSEDAHVRAELALYGRTRERERHAGMNMPFKQTGDAHALPIGARYHWGVIPLESDSPCRTSRSWFVEWLCDAFAIVFNMCVCVYVCGRT